MHPMGFEPTPPKRIELESTALDRSATNAYIYIKIYVLDYIGMLEVGFEPTPPKRIELKSTALDPSAIPAQI